MIQNHFEEAGLREQELRELKDHSVKLLHRALTKDEQEEAKSFYRLSDGKMAIENSLQIFRKASKIDKTIFQDFADNNDDK